MVSNATNGSGSTVPVSGEIARLQRRWVVELDQMERFHRWLDGKRSARQPCRVVGDSRTGKTIACDAYRINNLPQLVSGSSPIVPVVYWQSPPESGNRELFEGILSALRYQLSRSTLSEIRGRVYRTLKACQVEMLIMMKRIGCVRKPLAICKTFWMRCKSPLC